MGADSLFMTQEQMDALAREHLEMPQHIRIEDGCIVIDYGGYEYDIELSRIKSHEALLFWVLHLSEKSWMNPSRLHFFAELVAHTNGFKLKAF